ncbi:MAG TPA: hypothetical protein VEH06_14825 [Candidatus Bathyarchaeia archaeon]|nr:hypothetical protein [Candidatus Bathyarchaeia archaeon]
MNKELQEKIDSLSQQELKQYNISSMIIQRIIDIFGIGLVLLVFNFANFLTIIFGSILFMFLSSFSSAIGETRKYVKEKLRR